MFRSRHILGGLGLAGLIGGGVVGCGVSGHLTATSTHSGNHHVSGTAHTSELSSTPSPTTAPNTTSRSPSTAPSSTATPTSSGTTPSAAVTPVSPYNPVVAQALTWTHAHTALALGAPTWLPGMPSSTGAYLAATASATTTDWAVSLHGTAHPFGVNNPAIAAAASTHPWVSFGTQALSTSQRTTSPLSLLEAYSQMGPSHPAVTAGTPKPVALGDGITGTVYGNGTVLWHEGDWTMVVQGTSGSADVSAAKPLVAYLHTAYLPPHPGLVDVFQNTASVDWINGHTLVSIQGGPVPAVDVLHMAVTWRPWSS